MGEVGNGTVPELVGRVEINGAVGGSIFEVDQSGCCLTPPAKGEAGGGEHGAAAFDGSAVAPLSKRILLWGVGGRGEVSDALGGEECFEPVVDKLTAVVRDNQDDFVPGEGFGVGEKLGEETKSVGLLLHGEDELVFQKTVNDFQKIQVASARGGSDWPT